MINESLSQSHILLRSDLQIHRRTLDDGYRVPESFNKLCFVRWLKLTPLGVRIEQQLSAKDLWSLGGPQAISRNRLLDETV